jgi:hypothetical protein
MSDGWCEGADSFLDSFGMGDECEAKRIAAEAAFEVRGE